MIVKEPVRPSKSKRSKPARRSPYPTVPPTATDYTTTPGSVGGGSGSSGGVAAAGGGGGGGADYTTDPRYADYSPGETGQGSYMLYPQEAMDSRYASLYSYGSLYGDMTMYPYRYQYYDEKYYSRGDGHYAAAAVAAATAAYQGTTASPRPEHRQYDACLHARDYAYPSAYSARSESSTSETDTAVAAAAAAVAAAASTDGRPSGGGSVSGEDKVSQQQQQQQQQSVIMRRPEVKLAASEPGRPDAARTYNNGQCTYESYKQGYQATAAAAAGAQSAAYTSVIVDAQHYQQNGYVH